MVITNNKKNQSLMITMTGINKQRNTENQKDMWLKAKERYQQMKKYKIKN